MKMEIGDKFKLLGRNTIFTVVRRECENGAFGPQIVGHSDRHETRVLEAHSGYTFTKVD